MSAEELVCAFIKTDLRAEHLNCLSILLSLILILVIFCKEEAPLLHNQWVKYC